MAMTRAQFDAVINNFVARRGQTITQGDMVMGILKLPPVDRTPHNLQSLQHATRAIRFFKQVCLCLPSTVCPQLT